MSIILYDRNFISNLYEACLQSESTPLVALGEELLKADDVSAISLWSEHAQVQGALTRVAYQQKGKQDQLAVEDQKIAMRSQESREPINGAVTLPTRKAAYYWSTPLAGKRGDYYFNVWCSRRLREEEHDALKLLAPHVVRLADIVLSSDIFSVQRVNRELEATQFIQKQLMPQIDGLDVGFLAYRTLPVHELGGDYLDILRNPDGTLGLTVADAMGHGMPAAFVMLMARTIFRLITTVTTTPSEVLAELNNHFISQLGHVDTFVTQFYGRFDAARGRLTYANAGHNPPVHFQRKTGEATFLPGRGVALGGRPNSEYTQLEVELAQGDILVIYSDGLREARGADHSQFGLEGIAQTLLKYREYNADGICDGLIRNVMRHGEGQSDDISFIVIKR